MISIQNQTQIIFRRNVINIIQYYIFLQIFFFSRKRVFSFLALRKVLCSLQFTYDSYDILTIVIQEIKAIMIRRIYFSCFFFLFINATYNEWISQLF